LVPVPRGVAVLVLSLAIRYSPFAIPALGQAIDRPVRPEIRETFEQFGRAYDAGQFDQALTHALRLVELVPGLGTPEYNVACTQARLGRAEEALDWLARAIDCGYDDPDRISTEIDFASLHEQERFNRLLENARAQFAAPSAEFVPFAQNPDPKHPVPLLVVLHNFGGNARSAMNLWTWRISAIILAPKAPKRITASQARWTTPEVAARIILREIEAMKGRYAIDPSRVVLVGMSQGAEMAYALAAQHPELFRGLIAVAGHFPPEAAELLKRTRAEKLRVYLLVEEHDREVESCREAAKAFEAAGAKVELRVFSGGQGFLPAQAEDAQRKALGFVFAEPESSQP